MGFYISNFVPRDFQEYTRAALWHLSLCYRSAQEYLVGNGPRFLDSFSILSVTEYSTVRLDDLYTPTIDAGVVEPLPSHERPSK